ncbi:unnamed protein product [marine sediment metagenome]|uniref:Uncharacterized protein n=1 Tax=marine sediment metagenome TaxID=412755 RepID=X1JHI7_9ZZZZ
MSAKEALSFIDEVMQEFDLEDNQQIGTLIGCIEESDNPRSDDDDDDD